jgi:adenine-specific DNA-methyltransferase
MPTLDFKGKQFVHSHHLSVPFRELKVVNGKSLPVDGKTPSLEDNLIIHGDNLEALKALLPTHAGKVDCVFIDPPYNTGNEGWCYNDNLRSPLMKEWLKRSANPVDKEDLERHDKWLCMMWPRLQLLYELLRDDGTIFVSIDDNEIHRLRCLMEETFGEDQFAAQITVLCNPKGRVLSHGFADTHEYLLCFTKRSHSGDFSTAKNAEQAEKDYDKIDGEGLRYREIELRNTHREFNRTNRKNLWYPFYVTPADGKLHLDPTPGSLEVYPVWEDGFEGCWTWNRAKAALDLELLLAKKVKGKWKLFRKDYAKGARKKPTTVWTDADIQSEKGQAAFEQVMGTRFPHPPKALGLLERVLQIATDANSVILDSFAGSGTTAHAVLEANKKDGGNRRFILVECEDYADTLTAERIRRVVTGYPFTGVRREELLRENITWTLFDKRHQQTLERVRSIEKLLGPEYDAVKKEIRDGILTVAGEKRVEARAEGLGSGFTFCALGDSIDIESLLTGKGLPSWESLARYVFYTATGRSVEKIATPSSDGFVGETDLFRIHLFYQPAKEWLRSNEAAFNATRMESVEKSNKTGKRAVVFAVAKFMSQKDLTSRRIEFCQLPYAVHRILGD